MIVSTVGLGITDKLYVGYQFHWSAEVATRSHRQKSKRLDETIGDLRMAWGQCLEFFRFPEGGFARCNQKH